MKQVDGQMTFWDFLGEPNKPEKAAGKPETPTAPHFLRKPAVDYEKLWETRRKPGDLIARTILGDCYVAKITAVEGDSSRFWYRTDIGVCFDAEDGTVPVNELLRQARAWNGKRIKPRNLQFRQTWQWTRESDGHECWAQVGVYDGMVYWKDECTYEFLESCSNIRKKLEEVLNNIEFNLPEGVKPSMGEHPMKWLYPCKGGYASAEYAVRHSE